MLDEGLIALLVDFTVGPWQSNTPLDKYARVCGFKLC